MARLSLIFVVFSFANCNCEQVMVRDRDALCGNSQLDGDEQCDDGNEVNTDACTNSCSAARCGDGVTRQDLANGVDGFEQCDDGNDRDLDGCLNACRFATCGDGFLRQDLSEGEPGFEACDDGNRVDGDGCQADCTAVGLPPGGANLHGRTGMSQSGSSGSTLRGRAGESALPEMQSERFKLKGGIRRAAP